MALYSDFCYAIHIEFVLGYLAMFLACLVLICALSSYTSGLLRPDDLGKDIGSLSFRAYLSILPIHPKGGGPGGAKVVTSYACMVLEYAVSLGYDGAPRFDWGRPQVVTALSVRREAASRLAYSSTFRYRVGVHGKMKQDWMFSSAGHSPLCP
jgi:hypothetical protein